MEAGNRCFDFNVPEEINRKIADHTSDINLCYAENSRRNLITEGFPENRIFVSPLKSTLSINAFSTFAPNRVACFRN